MRHGHIVSYKGLRAVIALAVAVLSIMACFAPSQAHAADAAQYATWSDVSKAISQQLATGEKTYASGNTAGASSDFGTAYNTLYVATNFVSAASATLGDQTQQQLQQQFQSIQQLSYVTGNGDEIKQQIATLDQQVSAAAEKLDADTSLAKPPAYARQLNAQIEADRKKIDAAKKNRNNGKGTRSWVQVATEMNKILDKAQQASESGNGRKGSDLVNTAYYQYYEKLGFEKTVMNAISGNRVSQVEYQFKETRMAMVKGESKTTVAKLVSELKAMLAKDSSILDGGAAGKVSPMTAFFTSAFGQAFVVLLREGLEAILVVAAIIAYLLKAGHKDKIKYIYWGILAGLVGSGLVALLFTFVFSSAGAHQEMLEGVTALIAMVMLLFTSSWMLSKSSAESWNRYIKEKTVAAVSTGNVISLALLSFLAVFREGAETVMFYQAIFTMAPSGSREIWAGFAAAAILLVCIFLLIRFTSVRIPIRPFFVITSALMAIMVVIFAGGGVHALIEGDLIPATYYPSVPTNDWLGLYPYAQTIAAQIIAIIAVVTLLAISVIRSRRADGNRVGTADSVSMAEPAASTGSNDLTDR
ncbi:FTR1 family protein [Bifidobacterium fermentum]|uniref:FTR1 family iron permease n=1 Tax=Bifidobacterium fermentum TaxID=3059035 RepID=UPI0038576B9A